MIYSCFWMFSHWTPMGSTHTEEAVNRQAWAATYCWNKLLGLLLTWWRQPPLPPPTAPCCSPVKGDTRKKIQKHALQSHNTSWRCRFSFNRLLLYSTFTLTVSVTMSTRSNHSFFSLFFKQIFSLHFKTTSFSLLKRRLNRLLTMMQMESQWSSLKLFNNP